MTQSFRVIVGLLSLAVIAVMVAAAPSPTDTAAASPKPSSAPSFRQDIIPILTKAGCNSGGCHGKQAGQNGFKLSLRGYAPEWDYDAIVNDIGSRRIDLADAASSLLLQKAAELVAHEGGKRFDTSSRLYKTLRDWIDARVPGPIAEDVDPMKLTLSPAHQVMNVGATQPLKVTAYYPDGRQRDVTWLAQFYSNDPSTAAVSEDGIVTTKRPGESSIRAHFQNLVGVVTITTPYDHAVDSTLYAKQKNVIDQHVFAKLKDLHLPPSGESNDATFIRRAFLDATGTLPTPAEVRTFLADTRSDKRAKLIDDLLSRPEWTDYWTLQIADLLQNRKERDHDVRGVKGVRQFHGWLREQIAANRPWDELAREVLTVAGDNVSHPAVGYYIVTVGENREVEKSDVADSVAQAFLGTRIGCARCHNHPLEKYTQDDYYHFAAFFSRVSLKRVKSEDGVTTLNVMAREETDRQKSVDQAEKALAAARDAAKDKTGDDLKKAEKKIEDAEKRVTQTRKELADARMKMPTVNQPRTNKLMAPQPLDRTTPKFEPGSDPRQMLADWMTSPDNEYFAGAMVNRLWKHFMGVGLVEPVDDLRSSNPPSNPELFKALSAEFVQHKYDLKHIQRLILTSRAYQLDSATLPENAADTKFYSHYNARRLGAEVMLDAIAAATDVPDNFPGYPVGIRAVQLPDPGTGSYFLALFGRSDRVTACACERNGEVTLPQLLHLTNGADVQEKVKSAEGRLAKLLKTENDDQKVIDEVFLATVSKLPTVSQREAVKEALAGGDPREQVFQDLFWALLNSKEFAFNR